MEEFYLSVRIHALQYRTDEPSFGGLSSEEAKFVLPVAFSGKGRVDSHAFAPEYPAGVRFRKYDGGGELSSCFSVREDRIAMADIFIQIRLFVKVFI